MISTRQTILAKIALLIVVTSAAYLPAMKGGFVFDDETLVSNNILVNSSDGLYRIWFTNEAIDYWPMTNSTFWIEWRLWGRNPTGYHVTNLALHLAAALLVWGVLVEVEIPGSFLAALLFAVHPVNVESVAWISQRKNVLAIVFFLLSIWLYVHAEEAKNRRRDRARFGVWYGASLLAFLLAMLSKGSVAVLPVVLLLVVWWRGSRVRWSDWVRIAPFFGVAVALTAVNLWFRTHGSEVVIRDAGFAERLAGAGAAVWFYLSKALLPIRLLFIYPQWHIVIARLLWWLPLCGALGATASLVWQGWLAKERWPRALLFSWGIFCVALLPILGFMDVGFMQYSLVADHYQQIALIAVVAAVASGWWFWRDRSGNANRLRANGVAVALVGVLTLLTFQQSRLYGDPIKLYEATLRDNPDCWTAHNNLGVLLLDSRQLEAAKLHFEQALLLKSNYPEAHYNLGNYLAKTGRLTQAIEQYQEAVRIRPDYVEARNNLGIVLSREGLTEESIECFKASMKIQPRWAATYFNLGNVFSGMNRPNEAAEQYWQAVQLNPDYAEAWANLAAAYGDLNRWGEALAAASKAMELAHAQGLAEVTRGIEAWRAAKFAPGAGLPPMSRPRP